MSETAKKKEPVFILAGSSQQYTDARRKLHLVPLQAFWLTRGAILAGKHHPKVYQFDDWKSLAKLQEIEASLATATISRDIKQYFAGDSDAGSHAL